MSGEYDRFLARQERLCEIVPIGVYGPELPVKMIKAHTAHLIDSDIDSRLKTDYFSWGFFYGLRDRFINRYKNILV